MLKSIADTFGIPLEKLEHTVRHAIKPKWRCHYVYTNNRSKHHELNEQCMGVIEEEDDVHCPYHQKLVKKSLNENVFVVGVKAQNRYDRKKGVIVTYSDGREEIYMQKGINPIEFAQPFDEELVKKLLGYTS